MVLPTDTSWEALPERMRAEHIESRIIDTNGNVWHLSGPNAGVEGAMINGAIDGLGEIPGKGVWSETANSAPYFERWIDSRHEIAFRALLIDDHAFGWYGTRRRFMDGLKVDTPSWFTVTSRLHGEVWLPVLRDSVHTIYEDDPTADDTNYSLHELVLAASGDPRWRRPDRVGMWQSTNGQKVGSIRVVNRSDVPIRPYFICEAPGRIKLPDGPAAVITAPDAEDHIDFPGLLGLFGLSWLTPRGLRRHREPEMVIDFTLYEDEHTLIDTDPCNRIAISDKDPVDNIGLQFIRNSEIASLITGNAGERGQTIMERLRGQGFSVPIPARSEASLPVYHSRPGGRIWCVVPQRFDHAT